MIPGPRKIITCPNCQGLASYLTLLTGNLLGARVWTDGKLFAPMFPQPPAVVKCIHCEECYWLFDTKPIGMIDRRDPDRQIDPAWTATEHVEEPTEAEYYQAIEKGLATTPREERKLRILAWWRRNDAFRVFGKPKKASKKAAQHKPSPPLPWRENLQALLPLLDEGNNNDCLMKAEVLRELGDFEAAKQVLNRIDIDKAEKVAEFIRLLKAEQLRKFLRTIRNDLESAKRVQSAIDLKKPTAQLTENILLLRSLCDNADSELKELLFSIR